MGSWVRFMLASSRSEGWDAKTNLRVTLDGKAREGLLGFDFAHGSGIFRLFYGLQLRGDCHGYVPVHTRSSRTDILQDARQCAKIDDTPIS